MASLRRLGLLACAVVAIASGLILADPSPPAAQANLPCDAAVGPVDAITKTVDIGNPVGDACNTVTDPVLGLPGKALDPLKDAANSIRQGIFNEITGWVSEGAVWLLGEVVKLTEATTTPDLLSKGFVRQYRQMALIATLLGALMLLFAVFDSLGRGDAGSLLRVFLVNVPLAAIATSAAYVVVQLLVVATDGLCQAIAASTASNSEQFFKGAIKALSETGAVGGAAVGTATGGPGANSAVGAGAGGTVVPLFVGFIAAIVAAFAAFFVWVELLMRDAAIYVVALFMPLALAASIWPRWASALRRTCELTVVIVFSKFVIVAIISLAASLLANTGGKVEHVLAAAALLLLACFAPFVLFKLIPFAEGAISAAYSRQSGAGAAVQGVQLGSSVMLMRRAALANWGGGGSSSGLGSGGGSGGGRGGGGGSAGGRPGGSGGGGAASAGAGEGAAAGGAAAGAVAMPAMAAAAAAQGSKAAAGRLGATGTAQAASGSAGQTSAAPEQGGEGSGAAQQRAPRPQAQESSRSGAPSAGKGAPAGGSGAGGGEAQSSQTSSETKPPRPKADAKTSGAGKGSGG